MPSARAALMNSSVKLRQLPCPRSMVSATSVVGVAR